MPNWIEKKIEWLKKATLSWRRTGIKVRIRIRKTKKILKQVNVKFPSFSIKVGKMPVWAWITIFITSILCGALLGLYLAINWVLRKINTFKPEDLKTLLSADNREATIAIGLIIVMTVYTWWTREKKEDPPTAPLPSNPPTTPPTNPKSTKDTKEKKEEKEEKWLSGCAIAGLILMFCFSHALWFYNSETWWIENVLTTTSLTLHLALLVTILNLPKGKVPANQRMAWIVLSMIGIFLVYKGGAAVIDWVEHKTVAHSSPSSTPRLSPTIKIGTPACFKGELGPDKDAAYAAFPGQMDVLAAFCRESNFDNRKIGQNENGSTDTGIAQINSAHDAELKRLGLDKNKLEDNLRYARILYDKNGLLDWTPRTVNNRRLVFEVPVEPGNIGSNTFKLPYRDLKECLWAPDRPALLIVKGADGTEHQVEFYPLSEKNKFVDLDPVVKPIKEYRFKSKDDKKVLVTVTYQY